MFSDFPHHDAPVRGRIPPLSILAILLVVAGLSTGRLSAQEEKPSLYVLSVGVSQYQDVRIPSLQYAADDARAIEQWAQAQRGRIYGTVHVETLLDGDATRKNLVKRLTEFFKPVTGDDQIIVFLAGHGVLEQSTETYHFLTAETELDNVAGTAIEQDDILAKLEVGPKRRKNVLVLMDSCHAGALADSLVGLEPGKRGVLRATPW